MKILLSVLVFSVSLLPAADWRRAWHVSQAVFIGTVAADVSSSWGRVELNPLLRGSDGRFGVRGLVIKIGITSSVLVVQHLLVRRRPGLEAVAAVSNLAAGCALTGMAVRNLRLRPMRASPAR